MYYDCKCLHIPLTVIPSFKPDACQLKASMHWFLKSDSVWIVSMCDCVCPPPRL